MVVDEHENSLVVNPPRLHPLNIPTSWENISVNSMDSLESVMDAIESLQAKSLLAVGINCSAPRHVEGALRTMAQRTQVCFASLPFQ